MEIVIYLTVPPLNARNKAGVKNVTGTSDPIRPEIHQSLMTIPEGHPLISKYEDQALALTITITITKNISITHYDSTKTNHKTSLI